MSRRKSSAGKAPSPVVDSRESDRSSPHESEAIAFIFNDSFPSLDFQEAMELPVSTPLYADRDEQEFLDLTSVGLSEMAALPVLSFAGEQFLFRKMNYLKYRASILRRAEERSKKDAAGNDESEENLLASARAAREHLAECNLRLVASIARKAATAPSDFDELMSEGNVILLKAIDKFDYARGFRFSTYLTHSLVRHFHRPVAAFRRRWIEFSAAPEIMESSFGVEVDHGTEERQESLRHVDQMIDRMDECLTPREQWVVRERFGLGEGKKSRPFREIASEVGLSKERVRHIQLTAMQKLRELVTQLHGSPLDAALVE